MSEDLHLISHSEVDQFNQCEMKHHFAFTEKLQPIGQGAIGGGWSPLVRGSVGHKFLEIFLNSIKEHDDSQTAQDKAFQFILNENALLAAELAPILFAWVGNVWPNLGWKIIEVEYKFTPLNFGTGVDGDRPIGMPGTIDLIIEVNDPKYGKSIAIVDHKFAGDAYGSHIEALLPQIPKYIGALRANGINAKFGIYNYLRTRTNISAANMMTRFVQSPVYPSNARIKRHFEEHLETAKQINSGNITPVRTSNKINCGHCGFLELCTSRLNGEDTKLLEKHSYEVNSYSYDVKEVEE